MTYPIGMTCQDLIELVTEYLENTLSEQQRSRFEQHLAACPPCVAYVDQMRRTIRAVGELREESLEPGVRDQLLGVFQNWKRSG